MAVMCKSLGVLALAIQLCQAQFTLEYPTRIGFDYSLEYTAPCGDFTPDFSTDNITDFHVGGDTIAVTSLEEEATWLFRATLDETALGNWTSLLPVIQENKLGGFCEPSVTVPSSWAGNQGVIGVVQHASGGQGLTYQCAAVKFVAGQAATTPAVCMNMTDLTATYTSDASLSSIPASGGPTATASSVATTSSSDDSSNDSSSSSSSSTKKSSASFLYSQEASSTLLLAFFTSLFML